MRTAPELVSTGSVGRLSEASRRLGALCTGPFEVERWGDPPVLC